MSADEYASQAARVEQFDRNLIDAAGARLASEARARQFERDVRERELREDAALAVSVAREALADGMPVPPQAVATLAAALLSRRA